MGTGRPKKRKISWLVKSGEEKKSREDKENRSDQTSGEVHLEEIKHVKDLEETINELKQSEYGETVEFFN